MVTMVTIRVTLIVALPLILTSLKIISSESICPTVLVIAINAVQKQNL